MSLNLITLLATNFQINKGRLAEWRGSKTNKNKSGIFARFFV